MRLSMVDACTTACGDSRACEAAKRTRHADYLAGAQLAHTVTIVEVAPYPGPATTIQPSNATFGRVPKIVGAWPPPLTTES